MALEVASEAPHAALLASIEQADAAVSIVLKDTAASLLLYRIAGSTEKGMEISFLFKAVLQIAEDIGNPPEMLDTLARIKNEVESEADSSVNSLCWSMKDVLEVLPPRDLYILVDKMRKEPLHSRTTEGDALSFRYGLPSV